MKKSTKTPKAKPVTLDHLAGMVAGGFQDLGRSIDELSVRISRVEQGQEDIKLRLDNAAYRFELLELERRVEQLEKRTGITNRK